MKQSIEQLIYDLTEKLEYEDLDRDERDAIEKDIIELEDSLYPEMDID